MGLLENDLDKIYESWVLFYWTKPEIEILNFKTHNIIGFAKEK
jgi:hypothetical protein